MPTVTETLTAAISGAATDWPRLVLDDQINDGTMFVIDFANDAVWPTQVVGGPIVLGDTIYNLVEAGPNAAVETSGNLPTFSSAGVRMAATSNSIVFPAGSFDLPALNFPDFHMTVWGRTPVAPDVAASQAIAFYGSTTSSMFGVYGSYSSGATMGIIPRMFAQGSATQINLDTNFCVSMTCVNAGGNLRRIRTYVNNALKLDSTITPATAPAPTERMKIGKGSTSFAQFGGGLVSRMIGENCTISGVDPEVARASEFTKQHARFGL